MILPSGTSTSNGDLARLYPICSFEGKVHGVIALDILEKSRQGRDGEALKAFEASWKIAESLRQRPELISQWISLLVMNRQAAVLRKMRSVPEEWQNRVSNASLMTTFSEATRLDAVTFAQGLAESKVPTQLGGGGWADYFLDYPLSGPLRRLIGLHNLELTGQFLSKFGEPDPCRVDPKSLIVTVESSYSRWFFGENPALKPTGFPGTSLDLTALGTNPPSPANKVRIAAAKANKQPSEVSQVLSLQRDSLGEPGIPRCSDNSYQCSEHS